MVFDTFLKIGYSMNMLFQFIDKAILKRAYKQNDFFILQSENTNYKPMVYSYNDINPGCVRIIGKVIKVETSL